MLDNEKTFTRKGKAVFVDRRQTNEPLRSNDKSPLFKLDDNRNFDASFKHHSPTKQNV